MHTRARTGHTLTNTHTHTLSTHTHTHLDALVDILPGGCATRTQTRDAAIDAIEAARGETFLFESVRQLKGS